MSGGSLAQRTPAMGQARAALTGEDVGLLAQRTLAMGQARTR